MNPAARRILLVDDDDDLRTELANQLSARKEFSTDQAATGQQAISKIKSGQYDAVLLDVGLPDMDGRQVCQEMRNNKYRAPIIMLTAFDTDKDTIAGLKSGANDYVTKPFHVEVLIARLEAQLREATFSEGARFKIGPYSFMPAQKMLVDEASGEKIRLTEKEVSILKYLYRAEKAVGREELLHHVWGYNPNVATHTLETHIYRLRKKIEKDPSTARILVTEAGGYRLVP